MIETTTYAPGRMTARVLSREQLAADLPRLAKVAADITRLCTSTGDLLPEIRYRHGHVANAYRWQAHEYGAVVTCDGGEAEVEWQASRTPANPYVSAGWYYRPATLAARRALRSYLGLPASSRALDIRVL